MTAYESRISDWSSDVCSSDLDADHTEPVAAQFDEAADWIGRQFQFAHHRRPQHRDPTATQIIALRQKPALIGVHPHHVLVVAVGAKNLRHRAMAALLDAATERRRLHHRGDAVDAAPALAHRQKRTEESRVGKDCVSRCTPEWSA